jgi:hypothetical protein
MQDAGRAIGIGGIYEQMAKSGLRYFLKAIQHSTSFRNRNFIEPLEL